MPSFRRSVRERGREGEDVRAGKTSERINLTRLLTVFRSSLAGRNPQGHRRSSVVHCLCFGSQQSRARHAARHLQADLRLALHNRAGSSSLPPPRIKTKQASDLCSSSSSSSSINATGGSLLLRNICSEDLLDWKFLRLYIRLRV